MPDTDDWTRQPDGSYVNAAGWKIKLVAQGCWRITRPNGFHADQHVWPTLDAAQHQVATTYARQNVA